jgi:hypothetical protein
MGVLFAQTVEKLSASFTFPSTLTSLNGGAGNPIAASFFKLNPQSMTRGKIAFEWSVFNTNAARGYVAIYSLSGALVKKIPLSARSGAMMCDLGKTARGVYLAAISFGSYKQNLKLALYR